MCLAQGHNVVMRVSLEPATPRCLVKQTAKIPSLKNFHVDIYSADSNQTGHMPSQVNWTSPFLF